MVCVNQGWEDDPGMCARGEDNGMYVNQGGYEVGGERMILGCVWIRVDRERICCIFISSFLFSSTAAHEKGLVPLHVTCNGSVISKSVLFEYKARRAAKTQQDSTKQQQQQEWIELDDKQFQMALLETLEQIERRLCHGSPQVTQQLFSYLILLDINRFLIYKLIKDFVL
ncbi:putative calmodulin-binding transcription activator 1-like [Apostichopus japonicus]|uniref:Putative calmodulin-binding transcription activator 1-like n=1 Tax=Stichopus japonicus TaxID=307972 RepID=A0A2G8JWJ3_STIJA|nr:putative calmodulin-binding transcription activator 1-like [Apostichopus japonicus]